EAGADVYLTSDLRHHRASEASHQTGAPALIDVAHFACEWPWLPAVSAKVAGRFDVVTHVSTLNTDPWTTRLASTDEGGTRWPLHHRRINAAYWIFRNSTPALRNSPTNGVLTPPSR